MEFPTDVIIGAVNVAIGIGIYSCPVVDVPFEAGVAPVDVEAWRLGVIIFSLGGSF